MRRKMAFLLLILACSLMGCYEIFEDSAEFKRGRETKAMSLLKKYQTAASILQAETGRYPSLEELYEDGDYIGIISDAFYNAWDGLDKPEPLGGYLYSSIDTDAYGAPLDRMQYAGLCAYPAEPGKTGDLIICILADPRHFEEESIKEYGGVSHGEEWTFYTALYEDIGEPLYNWPSDETLTETFQALKKRSPREGLREAQRLAESVSKQQ
jgi:hypothetical protein